MQNFPAGAAAYRASAIGEHAAGGAGGRRGRRRRAELAPSGLMTLTSKYILSCRMFVLHSAVPLPEMRLFTPCRMSGPHRFGSIFGTLISSIVVPFEHGHPILCDCSCRGKEPAARSVKPLPRPCRAAAPRSRGRPQPRRLLGERERREAKRGGRPAGLPAAAGSTPPEALRAGRQLATTCRCSRFAVKLRLVGCRTQQPAVSLPCTRLAVPPRRRLAPTSDR